MTSQDQVEEPIDIAVRFTLDTTVDGFVSWLENYSRLEGFAEYENQRWYGLSGIEQSESGNQLWLTISAYIDQDHFLEALECENPVAAGLYERRRNATDPERYISFSVAPIGPQRIKVDAFCTGRILNNYFRQMLKEMAMDWPGVTSYSVTLLYDSKARSEMHTLPFVEFVASVAPSTWILDPQTSKRPAPVNVPVQAERTPSSPEIIPNNESNPVDIDHIWKSVAKYGTFGDLTGQDVIDIVQKTNAWHDAGGKICEYYKKFAPAPGEPRSYELYTLYSWRKNEDLNPQKRKRRPKAKPDS